MVAKLVIAMLVLAIILSVTVLAAFRYFQKVEEHEHEKDMFREKRDAELLSGDSYIEQELEQEKNE